MGNVEIGILYRTRKGVSVKWILEESVSKGVEKGNVPNSKHSLGKESVQE